MHLKAIHDEDDPMSHASQQMLGKRLEVVGFDVMVKDVEVQSQAPPSW